MSSMVIFLVAVVISALSFKRRHSVVDTGSPFRRAMAIFQKATLYRGNIVWGEKSTPPILSFRHFFSARF